VHVASLKLQTGRVAGREDADPVGAVGSLVGEEVQGWLREFFQEGVKIGHVVHGAGDDGRCGGLRAALDDVGLQQDGLEQDVLVVDASAEAALA